SASPAPLRELFSKGQPSTSCCVSCRRRAFFEESRNGLAFKPAGELARPTWEQVHEIGKIAIFNPVARVDQGYAEVLTQSCEVSVDCHVHVWRIPMAKLRLLRHIKQSGRNTSVAAERQHFSKSAIRDLGNCERGEKWNEHFLVARAAFVLCGSVQQAIVP